LKKIIPIQNSSIASAGLRVERGTPSNKACRRTLPGALIAASKSPLIIIVARRASIACKPGNAADATVRLILMTKIILKILALLALAVSTLAAVYHWHPMFVMFAFFGGCLWQYAFSLTNACTRQGAGGGQFK
jgi:hypothetical protein